MSISSIANRFSLYQLAEAYHMRLEFVDKELEKGGFTVETNSVDTVIVATCDDNAEVYTVATALCLGSDAFSVNIGTDLALARYRNNETVFMKARDYEALCRSLRT